MSEGWVGMEDEDQGFPMLVMYDPNYPGFSAILLMFSVPPGTKGSQLMTSRIATLPNMLPNFVLQEQKLKLINREEANVASWTFRDGGNPLFVQENQVLIKEDVAYLFVFTGPEGPGLSNKKRLKKS